MSGEREFDQYAESYDQDLNLALSITGEDKQYFAERRVAFMSRQLEKLHEVPRSVIDYGCGTGQTTALLGRVLRLDSAIGVDVSRSSLEKASIAHSRCKFIHPQAYVTQEDVDLVYCNGVFHHISEAERPSAIAFIYRCLRPGGIFAFWENNPWNPGTRYVMSQCCFDRDAISISASKAKGILLASGFRILSTNFLFIFPRFLKAFRALEEHVSAFPLGAQYQILCRKV